MSTPDPHTFLKAILAKDFGTQDARHVNGQPHDPLLITLSRDYGARGEAIAEQLASCLAIPLYDQEILERVAKQAKIDAFKFKPQDETVSAGVSTFLYSLLTGTAGEMRTYRRQLYATVLELAKQDCLLVGRGAHLILSGRKVFRVRIVGSKLVCAKRVAEEQGIPQLEAERKVYEVNTKRHKSILSLYGDSFEHCSLEHAQNFDLVINTDHISAGGAVSLVLLALRQAGFDLRQRVLPA